jgi:hypothetical protein
MGKRSSFERREADFYPTPRAAVVPLIPYLRGIRRFAEPCAGDGDLVGHLEAAGLRCVYARTSNSSKARPPRPVAWPRVASSSKKAAAFPLTGVCSS